MADGSGVPNLQPAVRGSAVVTGDPAILARTILAGPAVVLPADRPKFANMMPAFGGILNDRQTADLVNYLREAFGGVDGGFTAEQAKTARAKK